jgi:small-conductance mechanosensitive channel/CRP-like cAMP-binding protein
VIGYSLQLAAAALLLVSLVVRVTTRNRHVRRRQRLTIFCTLVWMILEIVLARTNYPADLRELLHNLGIVLLALAATNLVVVTLANPLREDRAPERFPVILQDTVIVLLLSVVATVVLRERVLALSAVGAVVLGFALQDTLGNAFAGLAIQTEKPFQVGQWIRVADREGRVEEITWRATKLRTKDNTFLIVPNNVMSREMVLNYSEPVLPSRISIDVGAAYDRPPNVVKAALLEAMRNAPLALREPAPDVLLVDFGGSAIVYRGRFWIADYGLDEEARDQVRASVWYVFKRHGIEIPWPIQIEYSRDEPPSRLPETTVRFAGILSRVAVFGPLSETDREELAGAAVERLYASGETIVRQGEPGSSMFIVCEGEVDVVLEPHGHRLATIGPNGFFGEMSLLHGAPRSATVRVAKDARLMEIDADAFRRFIIDRPAVLEPITAAAIARRDEIERSRSGSENQPKESHASLLTRVRRFLRLDV